MATNVINLEIYFALRENNPSAMTNFYFDAPYI